jgi:hypothetical protein
MGVFVRVGVSVRLLAVGVDIKFHAGNPAPVDPPGVAVKFRLESQFGQGRVHFLLGPAKVQ